MTPKPESDSRYANDLPSDCDCDGQLRRAGLGTWRVNTNRSKFAGGGAPRNLTVRIDPHSNGAVFTLERVEKDGRATTSSTMLYFDNMPRDFQDFDCAGAQSSRRLDVRTIEIRRNVVIAFGSSAARRIHPRN